jgi:hypothetical protein
MLDERTINLINADLDGELEAGEREDLEGILESSAEARAMRAELLGLGNMLDGLPEQLPPADLKRQILSQLAPPPGAAVFSLPKLFASFQPATAGLAFAAGLLMTVAFYELSPAHRSSADTASMVGTMVASPQGSPGLSKNDLFLKGDGFSGKLSLRETEDIFVLNFDLDSEDRTEIEVGLDRTGLAFGGFAETQGDTDKAVDSVAVSGGTLRVVNQGRQQFAVFLRKSSPDQAIDAGSITIGFSGDGDRADAGVPESD